MADNQLVLLSKAFAVEMINLCEKIRERKKATPYISRLINKKDGIVNKVFVEMLEKLGCDIQITYVKKETI